MTAKATFNFDHTDLLKSWQLEPRVVARAKLEEVALRGVRDKFPGAKIACGQGEFVRRPDDGDVDCTVTAGRETRTIKLEFDALTVADATLSKPWSVLRCVSEAGMVPGFALRAWSCDMRNLCVVCWVRSS